MGNTVQKEREGQSYSPSWFDRFTAWLEQLPGPLGIYYAIPSLLSVGIFIGVQASQGAYRAQGFFPWHIFLALQPVIPFGLMHYLDRSALTALERFRPALKAGEMRLSTIRFRMTTMPTIPALIATIVGVILYFIIFSPTTISTSMPDFRLSFSTISFVTVMANFLIMWAFYGLLIYHTIHQVAVIRDVFSKHTIADLFDKEPLYAFSNITGVTAMVLLLNSYGWMWGLVVGGALETNLTSALGVNAFFAVLSLFLFIWPLWGAHRLLVEVKRDALQSNAALMRKAIGELHANVENSQIEKIGEWQNALVALDLERTRLESVPTWPWRPEALRGLIAALVVPIIVWFMQFLLERVLGN
jgi:hypothetical protein